MEAGTSGRRSQGTNPGHKPMGRASITLPRMCTPEPRSTSHRQARGGKGRPGLLEKTVGPLSRMLKSCGSLMVWLVW